MLSEKVFFQEKASPSLPPLWLSDAPSFCLTCSMECTVLHFCVDNFYTNLKLFKTLCTQKIGACETRQGCLRPTINTVTNQLLWHIQRQFLCKEMLLMSELTHKEFMEILVAELWEIPLKIHPPSAANMHLHIQWCDPDFACTVYFVHWKERSKEMRETKSREERTHHRRVMWCGMWCHS